MFSPLQISAGLMYADQGPHVQFTTECVALDPAGISKLGYSSSSCVRHFVKPGTVIQGLRWQVMNRCDLTLYNDLVFFTDPPKYIAQSQLVFRVKFRVK